MVAKIVKASFPGHVVSRPSRWRVPFIFASPHSGRDYPARFMEMSLLNLKELRRSEDAYVDMLLPPVDDVGAPLLEARFPRAFLDVNRDRREIDQHMFTAPPVEGHPLASNRVLAGFGVIPKYAADCKPIYGKKLSSAEASARLKWCYGPYHDMLGRLIDECQQLFGYAIVIDWHSMPSRYAQSGYDLKDIVLGNCHGEACRQEVFMAWQSAFKTQGFTVAANRPYAGGHVTDLYGRPQDKVHVLQVEINRKLYLDEKKVAQLPKYFEILQERLFHVIKDATCFSQSDTLYPSQFAAE
ncbi:MAG: N-formylglutamate amidohydrolase [Pseudomonadota bacterium]